MAKNTPIAIVGIVLCGFHLQAAEHEQLPTPTVTPSYSHKYTGVGSCAAAGCHGAGQSDQIVGSEYNIWIADDPHAQAYNTLYSRRSRRIIELLDGLPPGAEVAAHKDSRCLTCHSMSDAPASDPHIDVITDGVGCEACHGASKDWIAIHYEPGFQHLAGIGRENNFGFQNIDSLARRAQICANCHVGSAGRDVNHDLIAAGHPRLQFEMGSYFAALPKHWSDKKDRMTLGPEFDAVLWAVGQLATSQAALDLLHQRATSGGPWPEFAEWSCSACHHELRDEITRQQRLANENGLSGQQISWEPWNHHLPKFYLRDLVELVGYDAEEATNIERGFNTLTTMMRSITADRQRVALAAHELAQPLGDWAYRLEQSAWNSQVTDSLSRRITKRYLKNPVSNWSSAAQVYDALASLQQSRLNRTRKKDRITSVLTNMYGSLAERQLAPKEYQYDPEQMASQLREVHHNLTTAGAER